MANEYTTITVDMTRIDSTAPSGTLYAELHHVVTLANNDVVYPEKREFTVTSGAASISLACTATAIKNQNAHYVISFAPTGEAEKILGRIIPTASATPLNLSDLLEVGATSLVVNRMLTAASNIAVFESIAALQATTGRGNRDLAFVFDQGWFRCITSDATAALGTLVVIDADGNRWVLEEESIRTYGKAKDIRQYGAVSGGTVDCTAAIQAAIDSDGSLVYIPTGVWLVNPAIGLKVKDGLTLVGDGDDASILLASGAAGSIIKRPAVTAGGQYIRNVLVSRIGVVLTHPGTADPANYEQIAFDLRHVTRSTISECYAGNYIRGDVSRSDPAAQSDAIQGYGVVCGTYSSGDPLYSGGEVNTIERCTLWGLKKGVVVDDATLSGASAAHATVVDNCDIQICELGIGIEQQYATGCAFRDCIIQAVQPARGSVNTTYALRCDAYENFIDGGYIEITSACDHALFFGATSARNTAYIHRVSAAAAGVTDNGTANDITIRDTGHVTKYALHRMRSGVVFGTSGGTTLNNYEEGTWTPTIIGLTGAGVGTYSFQVGNYTRIGRVVVVTFNVSWSAHTGSGDVAITGLPFASKNVSQGHQGGGLAYPAAYAGSINANESQIRVTDAADAAVAIGGTGQFVGTLTYHV